MSCMTGEALHVTGADVEGRKEGGERGDAGLAHLGVGAGGRECMVVSLSCLACSG